MSSVNVLGPTKRPAYDYKNNTFQILNPDGSADVSYTGEDAHIAGNRLANHFSPNRKVQDILINSRVGDYRAGSMGYKIKRKLQDLAERPSSTLPGRLLNHGPAVGGTAGAAIGLGTGALADWILDKINGGPRDSAIDLKLVGALAGGGIGATLGHYRKKYNVKNIDEDRVPTQYIAKSAAMYNDPRNVILEKLQGATDIGFAEKAKLAAAVRSMDRSQAQQLASMVRAALGFGVGALIARYLFGMKSVRGTMFGGIIGVLGTGLYKQLTR